MAHEQKADFVFRRSGRVHLNRRGRQFSPLLAAEVCASAIVMLDTPCSEIVWKGTGYPLHSPVSPSILLPCVTVCHHISTGVYIKNQLDATSYFIVLLIGSTCFGHYYAHHQELATVPNLQHTSNQERNDQCGNQHHSRELLMMGIVVPETC